MATIGKFPAPGSRESTEISLMTPFGMAHVTKASWRNRFLTPLRGADPQGMECCAMSRSLLLAVILVMTAAFCHASDRVLLPVEIVGGDGVTASRTVVIPGQQAESVHSLWLQVHGLRFSQQASIRINAGPWLPLSNDTVTVAEPARSFGGIGVFGTVAMTISLPVGTLHNGANTLTFRFNRTDGIVSGYRVLAFNFITADGKHILLQDDFIEDSPDSWSPPMQDSASIEAGKKLWNDASLLASGIPGSPRIQARCADCHARDGRDLKYFNFSNESIVARAHFHGLSNLEGEQIASYIRTLPVPNPGRPWNPPYQPGPGIDDNPASHWAAGSGLSWVLEHDVDALPYLLRQSGSAAAGAPPYKAAQNDNLGELAAQVTPDVFRPDGNLNARLIPIALQLPDWNQWLPVVHPKDAWGADFTRSDFAAFYSDDDSADEIRRGRKSLRAVLAARKENGYILPVPGLFSQWLKARQSFFKHVTRMKWTPDLARKVYSTQQWQLVKTWEVMHEFDLEESGREIFGPSSEARSWWSPIPAETAPAEAHIPNGSNGISGSARTTEYLNSSWYTLQVILNSGNHSHRDHAPVDWVYIIGHIKELYSFTGVPEPTRLLVAVTKAMQSTDPRVGPNDLSRGWRPDQNIDPRIMVSPYWDPVLRPLTPVLHRALTVSLLTAWIDKTQQYTMAEYLPLGSAHSYTAVRNYGDFTGGQIWQAASQFRDAGVPQALLERVLQYGTAYTDRAARIHYQ